MPADELPSEITLVGRVAHGGTFGDVNPEVVLPDESPQATTIHVDRHAPRVLSDRQKVAVAIVVLGVAAALVLRPLPTAIGISIALLAFFSIANLFKLELVRRALKANPAIQISRHDCDALRETDLPVYTILIPLYHEAQMVAQLVAVSYTHLTLPTILRV